MPGRPRSVRKDVRGLYLLVVFAVAWLVGACGIQLNVQSFCQPDPGEIVFGLNLDTTNTRLVRCAASFKREGDFAFVGVFPRHVTGTVVLGVAKDGGAVVRGGEYNFSSPGNFYAGQWHLSDFPGPGNYVLTMTFNGETLATGAFTLTP